MTDANGVELTVGAIVHWRWMNTVDFKGDFCPAGVGKILSFEKDDWSGEDAVLVLKYEERESREGTIQKLPKDVMRFTPEKEMLWKLENAC